MGERKGGREIKELRGKILWHLQRDELAFFFFFLLENSREAAREIKPVHFYVSPRLFPLNLGRNQRSQLVKKQSRRIKSGMQSRYPTHTPKKRG